MNSQITRMRLVGRLALALTLTLLLLAGSIAPVEANPGVIYVAPGAACGAGFTPCYGSIQAAVDAANEGDIIKVAAGTYAGVQGHPAPPGYLGSSTVTQVVYISKGVAIQGGYTTSFAGPPDPDVNPTTLDAEGEGRVIVIAGNTSPTIAGLRITGGNAAGLGGADGGGGHAVDSGGGVYVINATATFTSNTIYSNTAFFGGGLHLEYSDSHLAENTVRSNTSEAQGGGLYLDFSDAAIIGNTIYDNDGTACGGGLALYNSDATIIGNRIYSNSADYGGGVDMNSPATLTGNIIHSNSGVCGGGLRTLGDAILINNVIADNQVDTTGHGSAIHIRGCSPDLLHNTIAHNSGGDGSGVYVTKFWWTPPSTVALTNTVLVGHGVGISVTGGNTATINGVLWHDTPITVSQSTTATVTVQNQHQGDPAFTADGYHLTTSSAAIDQGVAAGVASDIDGDPRPMGHGYDLGADEFRVALKVTKHADPDLVAPGEQLTYTISVINTGAVDLNAVITDTLPTHVTSRGTAFLPGGGIGITWTANITAPGGAWVETVVVTVAEDYEGPLTNLVEVTTEEGATGEARVIVNPYKAYLPLVLRNY